MTIKIQRGRQFAVGDAAVQVFDDKGKAGTYLQKAADKLVAQNMTVVVRGASNKKVTLATAAQTANGSNPDSDWNQGYGFQFWRCRHNAFRGDGAFGQFCLVMPEHDAVLAITAGQGDMQKTLNLVWQHLLPDMHDGPLPADDAASQALTQKLGSLSHPPVQGEPTSPTAAKITGKTFTLESNGAGLRAVTCTFEGDTPRLVFQTEHGEQRFDLGVGKWARQVVPFYKLGIPAAATTGPQSVAASAAWTAPEKFSVCAWLNETPYRLSMQFAFDTDNNLLTLTTRLHPLQGTPTTIKGHSK